MLGTTEATGCEARSQCLMAQLKKTLAPYFKKSDSQIQRPKSPPPAKKRRIEATSAIDSPHWHQDEAERDTVLYLAYGSNLAFEKFQKDRGIEPISQINVVVPELSLTFDLPGIPYSEPCFSNTARRDLNRDVSATDYHKDRWHKGLVGVVYEVTREDYAHIIATEGGGAAYHDVFVQCYPLTDDPTVPEHPNTTPFAAHTLFAPADEASKSQRLVRPDPSYAQASARYLKFFTDGADEHSLPQEYKEFLHELRPYRITTRKQTIGSYLYLAIWVPFILFFLKIQAQLADEDGNSPAWLAWLFNALTRAAWASYDGFFARVFGDGERSIPDGGKASLLSRKLEKAPDVERRLMEKHS
jgi:hypothetical protein